MKKETKHLRADIVNKSLNYIYKYIDTNITLDELAKLNSVSKYHFLRIFKEEVGENLFERITSIRLQKALGSLASLKDSKGHESHSTQMKESAEYYSRLVLKRSKLAMDIEEDFLAVEKAAKFNAAD